MTVDMNYNIVTENNCGIALDEPSPLNIANAIVELRNKLVDIYADEGLTGTCMDKRDELHRLIKDCKKDKVDRIIVKSVSRFARNTQELLTTLRMLKEFGVSVYFEEQDIDTDKLNMEMIVTFPGMAAQQESESISGNMRWSYKKRMESGEFNCCTPAYGFQLENGQLTVNETEASVIQRIFALYLQGVGKQTIATTLNRENIPRRYNQKKWYHSTIHYILNNERYNGKRKVKQVGTKTEQGKYSSKYALTELLICGECGTPYRRCTWTAKGKKKIVWRCINRLDYGKKYCHESPTIEESVLQEAIMGAIIKTAKQNADVLKTLKLHVGMGLQAADTEDDSLDLQIRIAEIDAEFKAMLQAVDTNTLDSFDEDKASRLMKEKNRLQHQLDQIADAKQKRENAKSRLDEIFTILEGLTNHPMTYDDQIVRQILECIVVESKDQIKVVFVGGTEVIQTLC